MQYNKAKPCIEAVQGNTTGGKESQEQTEGSKTHLFLLAGDSEKHQPNNHNLNAEDLVQMEACSMLVTSVSVIRVSPA